MNWEVDGNILKIIGAGELNGYPYTLPPWYNFCDNILSIEVEAGVTSVGRYAFVDCTNAIEIYFVGDAPTIKEDSFSGMYLTAYYPADNSTWTTEVMRSYGGWIEWVPIVYEQNNELVRPTSFANYCDIMDEKRNTCKDGISFRKLETLKTVSAYRVG